MARWEHVFAPDVAIAQMLRLKDFCTRYLYIALDKYEVNVEDMI